MCSFFSCPSDTPSRIVRELLVYSGFPAQSRYTLTYSEGTRGFRDTSLQSADTPSRIVRERRFMTVCRV